MYSFLASCCCCCCCTFPDHSRISAIKCFFSTPAYTRRKRQEKPIFAHQQHRVHIGVHLPRLKHFAKAEVGGVPLPVPRLTARRCLEHYPVCVCAVEHDTVSAPAALFVVVTGERLLYFDHRETRDEEACCASLPSSRQKRWLDGTTIEPHPIEEDIGK